MRVPLLHSCDSPEHPRWGRSCPGAPCDHSRTPEVQLASGRVAGTEPLSQHVPWPPDCTKVYERHGSCREQIVRHWSTELDGKFA